MKNLTSIHTCTCSGEIAANFIINNLKPNFAITGSIERTSDFENFEIFLLEKSYLDGYWQFSFKLNDEDNNVIQVKYEKLVDYLTELIQDGQILLWVWEEVLEI